ncbi:MAG: hypothetical protein J07AB43_02770 [Candidatus Nanosalina sp. J07AB43]|nr:MAG: hypothetical protein J07AB43_02770 [Candidatus Nanosalina sp. J07AB43]
MNPKHLIPGVGPSSTVQRIKKLEKKAATLPVLFALFFSEAIKIAALGFPHYNTDIVIDVVIMIVLAIVTGLMYVLEVNLENVVN